MGTRTRSSTRSRASATRLRGVFQQSCAAPLATGHSFAGAVMITSVDTGSEGRTILSRTFTILARQRLPLAAWSAQHSLPAVELGLLLRSHGYCHARTSLAKRLPLRSPGSHFA